MVDLQALACCLDDVYNNSTDITRKITSSISGEILTLKFITIKNYSRRDDLEAFKRETKREAVKLIDERIKSIKALYRENSGSYLKVAPVKSDTDNAPELITYNVQPYNETITYKIIFTQRYELKG